MRVQGQRARRWSHPGCHECRSHRHGAPATDLGRSGQCDARRRRPGAPSAPPASASGGPGCARRPGLTTPVPPWPCRLRPPAAARSACRRQPLSFVFDAASPGSSARRQRQPSPAVGLKPCRQHLVWCRARPFPSWWQRRQRQAGRDGKDGRSRAVHPQFRRPPERFPDRTPLTWLRRTPADRGARPLAPPSHPPPGARRHGDIGGAPVVVQSMTNTDTADVLRHRDPGRAARRAGSDSCASRSTTPGCRRGAEDSRPLARR